MFAKRDDDESSERDVRERSTIKWWDVSEYQTLEQLRAGRDQG